MLRNIFKESPMIELYCLPSIRTNLLYSMSFGIILLLQVGQCLATPQTGSISVMPQSHTHLRTLAESF